MPTELLDLPVELVNPILGHLQDIREKYNVSLTCKALHHLVAPFLYSRYVNVDWDMDARKQDSLCGLPIGYVMKNSLWPFVRTLLQRPKLGLLVKEVQIGSSWAMTTKVHYDEHGDYLDMELPINFKEELVLITLYKKTFPENDGPVDNEDLYTSRSHPRLPTLEDFACLEKHLILPLLCQTRNLQTLQFVGGNFGDDWNPEDSGSIRAISRMSALTTYSDVADGITRNWNQLIEKLEMLLSLPLRRIDLNIHVSKADERPKTRRLAANHGAWTAEHLSLTVSGGGAASNAVEEPMQSTIMAIVNSCKQLKSFSFDQMAVLRDNRMAYVVNRVLEPHRHSITRLSIGAYEMHGAKELKFEGDPFLPHRLDLSGLNLLKDLVINVQYFADWDIGMEPHPFLQRLHSSLPSSLVKLSLIICTFDVDDDEVNTLLSYTRHSFYGLTFTQNFPHLRYFSFDFTHPYSCQRKVPTFRFFGYLHESFKNSPPPSGYFVCVSGDRRGARETTFFSGRMRSQWRPIWKQLSSYSLIHNNQTYLSFCPDADWYAVEFDQDSEELPVLARNYRKKKAKDTIRSGRLVTFWRMVENTV